MCERLRLYNIVQLSPHALTMPVQLLGFLSLFLIRDGQLCVIYSRWHRPRLGPNAAMGFSKIIDGPMRFEGLLVIAR